MFKHLFFSLLVCISLSANENNETSLFSSSFTKTEKLIMTNAAVATVVLGWGFSEWGYGDENFHYTDEGWFEKDTPNGGADKLGHFYSNYLITRILSPIYEGWGYSNNDAALYASLTSAFFSAILIEVGDGFSVHGFSKNDLIADMLGVGAGYILATQPSLANKIDFRVEYNPFLDASDYNGDFTTDYERMKHLMVIKAEGFEAFEDNYMKYLELHIGYYTRNFDHGAGELENRERNIYVGIGINLSKLLRPTMGNYSKIFNYYQTPYTYIEATKEF